MQRLQVPSHRGWVMPEGSKMLLRAIFPCYPETRECHGADYDRVEGEPLGATSSK